MIQNKGKAEEFERLRKAGEGMSTNNMNKGKSRLRECNFNFLFILADSEEEDEESEEDEDQKPKKSIAKGKNKEKEKVHSNLSNLSSDNCNNNDFTKLKRRRPEEKKESSNEINDLMKRIINFLLFISKNIDSNSFTWETNKDLLLKVFDYLKDFKINNPIDFLKVKINY